MKLIFSFVVGSWPTACSCGYYRHWSSSTLFCCIYDLHILSLRVSCRHFRVVRASPVMFGFRSGLRCRLRSAPLVAGRSGAPQSAGDPYPQISLADRRTLPPKIAAPTVGLGRGPFKVAQCGGPGLLVRPTLHQPPGSANLSGARDFEVFAPTTRSIACARAEGAPSPEVALHLHLYRTSTVDS
jgi:hypothetical protein